jgi:hypothetical protein
MKCILTLVAACAVACLLFTRESLAQSKCGPCASARSIAACVACSRPKNPGNWTEDGMTGWCYRNMAACKKK